MRTLRLALLGAVLVASLIACSKPSKASRVSASDVNVFHLKPGNCVSPPTDIKAEISSVKVVSCSSPHTQEVFALVNDTKDQTYPGESPLQVYASGVCLQQFHSYVGVDYRDSSLFYTYLLPSARWLGQRERPYDHLSHRNYWCALDLLGEGLESVITSGSQSWLMSGQTR